jgi:hypothetical protein
MSIAPETKAAGTPARMPANNPKRCAQTIVSKQRLQARVSLFANGYAKKPSAEITIADFVRSTISGGDHAALVDKIQAAKDKASRDRLKMQLPAVSLSGLIEGLRAEAMAEGRMGHSGWLQIDLDAKDIATRSPEEIRELLATDPHILCAWLSPSGTGAKALMAIPVCRSDEEHKAAFLAAENYFRASYSLRIDASTKDSGRLCFMSADADLRHAATPPMELDFAAHSPKEEPKAKPKPCATNAPREEMTVEAVREMLATIPPRPPYEEWIKIASAVWDALGEDEGTSALCEWSPEETPGEYAAKHAHRLERVTAGTLVHTAKENGWKPPRGILKGLFQRTDQPEQEAEAAPPFNPVDSFFYDGTKYFLDAGHQYIPMDQRSVVRHLKNAGITDAPSIDETLCGIQVEKFISYAGALAGHPRGLHVSGGCRLLATTSPEIIQPALGQWPTIRAVLEGLLLDDIAGKVQLETFLGWLKFARESLTSNRRRPGQAIALAGQRGSGKSLLLDLTELALGGRRANPYAYFTGRTNFNADIAGAELLAVDDEAGSCDIRSRKTFAANIKSCLFSGSVRIEPKHRTAFLFRPVWRMVLALNDEPEALLVLPPITEDIADKLTLLRCHRRPLPMPAHTLDEREAFFAKLRSELPALLDWLEKWDVPGELREERCGVTFYHHPELLASLHQLSPEGHLAALVDTLAAAADGFHLPWTGTASELKASLCIHSTTARDADKLLQSPNSTGTYLGRLEGSRVERLPQHGGIQRWRFNPS